MIKKKVLEEEAVSKARKLINNAEIISIIVHVGPDGDAMGSSLGLYHYLKAIGKEVTVVVPSSFPSFLSWMPGAENVVVAETNPELAIAVLNGSELIFALDFNALSRLDKLADFFSKTNAKKILVDHHLHPENFADVTISHPIISSTSELVFRLICRMGDFSVVDLACAECIYVGMMTDTGAFTYNSNDPDIYSIIHELLNIGVDKDKIYRKVFNTYSIDRLKLMGYCLHEKMKIFPQQKTALITLTQEELKKFNFKSGDAEGFVNLPLSIDCVDFSVFMREDTDKIKISLRSQGSFPSNKVAAALFNGGGHLNASGGESYMSLSETIRVFEEYLPQIESLLEK